MTVDPIISIIIPVYNRSILVAEAVNSVLAQTNPNWELIVVDDGSTDNTWEVLESYAAKDKRIRIFKRDREPKGASTCRNIGISKVSGRYLMFIDSDDLITDNCIDYRLHKIKDYPGYDAWIFPTGIFREKPGDTNLQWNRLKADEKDLVRFLNMDMPWDISGPIWKLDRFSKKKWFDEYAQSIQDWEFHTKQLIKGFSYLKIDDGKSSIQTFYRKSENHESISKKFYEKEKLINRTSVFQSVLKSLFSKTELSTQERIAANRLITRLSLKMVEKDLKTEASELSELLYFSGYGSKLFKEIFRFYLNSKSKKTFFNQIFEFILYRLLNKGYLFDPPSSFFMREPIKNL